MPLTASQKDNFNTLRRAFRSGDAALMECQLAATGESVAVVCAANRQPDKSVNVVPFVMFFPDDLYRILNPPSPDGGFFTQEEVHGKHR